MKRTFAHVRWQVEDVLEAVKRFNRRLGRGALAMERSEAQKLLQANEQELIEAMRESGLLFLDAVVRGCRNVRDLKLREKTHRAAGK
jgi:hypothetical protein